MSAKIYYVHLPNNTELGGGDTEMNSKQTLGGAFSSVKGISIPHPLSSTRSTPFLVWQVLKWRKGVLS